MAVSKITRWDGIHSFSNFEIQPHYDVYADMSNSGAQPYLCLNGCRIRALDGSSSALSAKAPFTVRIRINGAGSTYTFNSGSTIRNDATFGPYITFSSSTNINIPKNGTAFTLNLTVTTSTGENYTIVEHACGPVSNTISGPSSIYTGSVSTYTLATAVKNDSTHSVEVTMRVHFPSEGGSAWRYDGYASAYSAASSETSNFTTVSFVPLKRNATNNDTASPDRVDNYNYIELIYYYKNSDTAFCGGKVPISYDKKWVTIKARAEVNSALKPEFESITYNTVGAQSWGIDYQRNRYGAVIQNHAHYNIKLRYRVKYGGVFTACQVTDYLGGDAITSAPGSRGSYIDYDRGLITGAGNNMVVQYRLTDVYGFVTTYTDRVTVKPYANPEITVHTVRRCARVSSGSGSDIYSYNGNLYQINDYGEYALIEWGVNITSLDDINSKSLRINSQSITLPSYTSSGYYVIAANGERSFDFVYELTDDFEYVTHTTPLSTIAALIDFYRGGTGMGIGKAAETPYVFDLHRNWLFKMPYDTFVGNYPTSGSEKRIRTWMTEVENRMQAILDHRDVIVYGEAMVDNTWSGVRFWDGTGAFVVPSGYGTVSYPNHAGSLTLNSIRTNSIAGLVIGPTTIRRRFIKFGTSQHGIDSFIAQGWGRTSPYPVIYVMSTRPTTINQSTGVPNGTVLTQRTLTPSYTNDVGNSNDGFTAGYFGVSGIAIDVSSWRGSAVYIVIVVRNGQSPSGYYQFTNANVNTGYLYQSDRNT